ANAIVKRDASGNFAAGSVTLAGSLALLPTGSASVGVITIGGTPFLQGVELANTFVGNAGNFTTGGNSNTGVGSTALINIGSGSRNTAVGPGTLVGNPVGQTTTA